MLFRSYDRDAARDLLRYLYAPTLEPGPFRVTAEYTSQVARRLLTNANLFKMTVPGEMLFLNRVNFGLMSIFVDLGAEIDWHGLSLGLTRREPATPDGPPSPT